MYVASNHKVKTIDSFWFNFFEPIGLFMLEYFFIPDRLYNCYESEYRVEDKQMWEQFDKIIGRFGGGGVEGGAREGRAPAPLVQNVFIFMQFLGKIGQIIGRGPPSGVGAPLWKIMDPPLKIISVLSTVSYFCLLQLGS